MSRRKYVESQIKNVHDSQKWFWVVLAGFSVISAIKWILEYWASISIDSICPFDNFISQVTPFGYFAVLIYVIYRFYLGDNRILDHYYDSVPKSILETEDDKFWTYIGRLSPFKIWLDSTGRIIQYLFIVAAALSLHEIEYFLK